jgi:hypothetical protein
MSLQAPRPVNLALGVNRDRLFGHESNEQVGIRVARVTPDQAVAHPADTVDLAQALRALHADQPGEGAEEGIAAGP